MIPARKLGKTGVSVSVLGLGGQAALEKAGRADEAENLINKAIDLGINYLDTAPTYGDGQSELDLGRVMKYRRSEVFLATKTLDRTYDGTMRQVEKSLERLQTDHLDLYQIHNVKDKYDLEIAFSRSGSVKALEKLREEQVIRFLGITGHYDSGILLEGIREYPFDCILMTLNAGDVHEDPFQDKLLREAAKREMGIIGMKVTATGRIFGKNGLANMKQALSYVLTFPVSTAIVSMSNIDQLEENVRLATEFKPLTDEELKELEDMTASIKGEANHFKRKFKQL